MNCKEFKKKFESYIDASSVSADDLQLKELIVHLDRCKECEKGVRNYEQLLKSYYIMLSDPTEQNKTFFKDILKDVSKDKNGNPTISYKILVLIFSILTGFILGGLISYFIHLLT